jgi:hypothetical protein
MYVHWTAALLFLIVFGVLCFGCGLAFMQYRKWQDAEAAANRKLEEFVKGIASNMDEKDHLDAERQNLLKD